MRCISLLLLIPCLSSCRTTSPRAASNENSGTPAAAAISYDRVEADFDLPGGEVTPKNLRMQIDLTPDSFDLSKGKIVVSLTGDASVLEKHGLSGISGLEMRNSGQDYKCSPDRCAAFTIDGSSGLLVSVMSGGEGRIILSWKGKNGEIQTADAAADRVKWLPKASQ